MKISGFNWDEYNRLKCQKHGLSIDQIEGFLLSSPLISKDDEHSHDEDRFVAFGTFKERYLVAIFCLRVFEGQFHIRVISARYARHKEIEAFHEKELPRKIRKTNESK
ncbi:BrnT family toxin [Bdellovibrio sp. HCB209]|uniref:BrnT family toxin n=1 Tax=Bdellovibrio sp. HCB209 TaxID=3394354 RepID=UPI0039B52D5F